MRLAKGHEIQRHNVPRHRTIRYELALLDWRRSLALHLFPRSLAFRSRPAAAQLYSFAVGVWR